jgi:GrpB-like predicted nucleotidyltransferase (UPF0157 family)
MIVIHPYRAAWPAEFDTIRNELASLLGERARKIAHIGSTSVPGLAAKDVIDIQIGVDDLASDIVSRLSAAGYEFVAKHGSDHVPEGEEGLPDRWRKLYFRGRSGLRPCHIHVRVRNNPNHRYALLFRDYLRAHAGARMIIELIKRELARLHGNDADAYYAVKDPVYDLIWQAANEWAVYSGWHQDAAPDA